MTVAFPVCRALTTRFAGRSYQIVTRCGYNPWLARVDQTYDGNSGSTQSQKSSISNSARYFLSRSYATTARGRPAGRPKATTARTPAKRTTKPAAKKPGPKTAAGKKKVGRKPKPKAAARPRKTVKKAPSKTALVKQRRDQEKTLKEKALLDEPKSLAATPWRIIFNEFHKKGQIHSPAEAQQATKEAAQKLKNLTPEEKEHYNHEARLAADKNEKAHKQWLSQYSPDQIREANNARDQLKRISNAKRPARKHASHKFVHLKDDRLVKNPVNSYAQFSKERHASGDFKGMTVAESGRLLGREWKSLTAAEKKPFTDLGQADLSRYREEVTSVYGKAPKSTRARQSS